MSELYDAIRRIQELEEQNKKLRKQLNEAVKARNSANIRADWIESQSKVSIPSYPDEEVFKVIWRFDDWTPSQNQAAVDSYAIDDITRRFKTDLGETIYEQYVKDKSIQCEYDYRNQQFVYTMSGKLKVLK